MFNISNLYEKEEEIVKKVLIKINPKYSSNSTPYNPKSVEDIKWTILFFVNSYKVDNAHLFEQYLSWLNFTLVKLGFEDDISKTVFEAFKEALQEIFDDKNLNIFLDKISIVPHEENFDFTETSKYPDKAKQYLHLLLEAQKNKAIEYINDLLNEGMSLEDLYIEIFQKTLYEVGNLWQKRIISVAKEHYCTALTQYIMGTLYERIFTAEVKNKKLIAAAVGDELHEIGIRMIADIYEKNGWDTAYLGANMPIEDFVDYTKKYNPDLIALSITISIHTDNLAQLIEAIRADKILKNKKIIVGGRPFIENPTLYKNVGADAYANDLIQALKVGEDLVG